MQQARKLFFAPAYDSFSPAHMAIVAISIGHTRTAQGAVSIGGVTEFAYNTKVAQHLKRRLLAAGVEVVVVLERDRLGIHDVVRRAAQAKADVGIELHFNSAADPSANGCETLYATTFSIDLAHDVQVRTRGALALRDRGLVKRATGNGSTYLVGMEKAGIPAVLVEPFFGSSPRDWSRVHDAHADVAAGLSAGIGDYLHARHKISARAVQVLHLPPK
jgi:N-acetylmuramoyl-L-alanine amidase